jgi:spore germination cell wall hydrolase CwlJ-like protein
MTQRTANTHDLAEEIVQLLDRVPPGAEAMRHLRLARGAGDGGLRQRHLTMAQRAVAQLDPARERGLIQRLQAEALALQGRAGDSMVAHVTPGELVIPRRLQTPELMRRLASAARAAGIDSASLRVGESGNAVNPVTGQPEFGHGPSLDDLMVHWDDPPPVFETLPSLYPHGPLIAEPLGSDQTSSPDTNSVEMVTVTGRRPIKPEDVDNFARLIFSESRGRPDGWGVVADVALNRVGSPGFPDNLHDVIFQPKTRGGYQFDGVNDPSFHVDPATLTGSDAKAWAPIQDYARSRIEDAMTREIPRAPRFYRNAGLSGGWFDRAVNAGRLEKLRTVGPFDLFEEPGR